MKYKALVSFSGAVTASLNQIIEINDEEIANDLLNAGYITLVKDSKKTVKDSKNTEEEVQRMKVSELTKEIVANYIRVEITTLTTPILELVLPAAITYCATYTGLEPKDLDEYEDMALAVLALCGEFYDNRTYTAVENAIVNPTTQAILDKYSMNLMEGYQHVSQGQTKYTTATRGGNTC